MRSDHEQLLIKLLSIESVESKPEKLKEALEFLLALLPEGFTSERFLSNDKPSALVYYGAERPETFEVILNAHLDVVPAKPEQFVPVKKDGQLYARGACDMKSAALIMTLAFIDMAVHTNKPIGLQLVTDEELGGADGTGYQMNMDLQANFAIIGEHTDLEINTESKGVCMLELTAMGHTAHGAYQWQGVSAIDILLRALMNLRKAYPIFTEETWNTTLNIAYINTRNTAMNALADHVSAHLDFRYVPGDILFSQDESSVMTELRDIANEDINLKMIVFESEHVVPESNRYVQLLAESLSNAANEPAKFVQKHGASDVRYFTQRGIEGVTFGPMCKRPHCDDESVDLAGLQTYYRVLCEFLGKL